MNIPAYASGVVRLGERKPAVMAEIHPRQAAPAVRRDMTAVCATCGTVYWTAKGHRCSRRRSCDHLPRSRYARLTAEVAALRDELGAVGSHVEALSEAIAAAYTITGRPVPAGLQTPGRTHLKAVS
jgi:hypothetical protein